MELQAHAEHQKDDPDFRQLSGHLGIGDKSRGPRPDHITGNQIAHDRRQADPIGDGAKQQCETKAERDRQNQRIVHERPFLDRLRLQS